MTRGGHGPHGGDAGAGRFPTDGAGWAGAGFQNQYRQVRFLSSVLPRTSHGDDPAPPAPAGAGKRSDLLCPVQFSRSSSGRMPVYGTGDDGSNPSLEATSSLSMQEMTSTRSSPVWATRTARPDSNVGRDLRTWRQRSETYILSHSAATQPFASQTRHGSLGCSGLDAADSFGLAVDHKTITECDPWAEMR